MNQNKELPGWVWVVSESLGNEENIFAFEDEKTGRKFIPVFRDQEEGVVCQRGFKKKTGYEYNVEAMSLAFVALTARENNMDIYFLDSDGSILETLTPQHDA